MILQRYMFSKNTFVTSKKLFSNGVFVFKKKKMFSLLFLRDLNFCKKNREEEEERNVFQDKCDLPRWSFLLKKKKMFFSKFPN